MWFVFILKDHEHHNIPVYLLFIIISDLVSCFSASKQSIPGTPPIPDGYNPATWMLEVTTPAAEERIGQDFAVIYKNSMQYR